MRDRVGDSCEIHRAKGLPEKQRGQCVGEACGFRAWQEEVAIAGVRGERIRFGRFDEFRQERQLFIHARGESREMRMQRDASAVGEYGVDSHRQRAKSRK